MCKYSDQYFTCPRCYRNWDCKKVAVERCELGRTLSDWTTRRGGICDDLNTRVLEEVYFETEICRKCQRKTENTSRFLDSVAEVKFRVAMLVSELENVETEMIREHGLRMQPRQKLTISENGQSMIF